MPNPRLKMSAVRGGIKRLSGTVARTDTAQKKLFTLPPGAVPVSWEIDAAAAGNSNAGTTAVIDVGTVATPTLFIAAHDVKTLATGGGSAVPKAQGNGTAISATAPTPVYGRYAETGGASSAGGPWRVTCFYE